MQENQTPHSPNVLRRPRSRSFLRDLAGPFSATRARRLVALFAVTFAVAAERDAFALQGGEDASTLPVLIDQQHGLSDKFQVSLLASTTLASKYTEGTGLSLNLQYNFIDIIGLELVGAFYLSDEAQILSTIRQQDVPAVKEGNRAREPDLADMAQMQWVAAANVVVIPIYGKISFVSEWNPSYDLYLVAGGGVVGTRRGRVDETIARPAGTEITPDSYDSGVSGMFNFGGGLRLFLTDLIAVRLEVRNYFYGDPDADGLTNALVGQLGVQLSFGGEG